MSRYRFHLSVGMAVAALGVLLFYLYSYFSFASITNGGNALDLLGQFNNDGTVSYVQGGANNGPGTLGLYNPVDVALDSVNHRLFVSDNSNFRVLIFNLNSSNQLVDRAADNVLGQTDFFTTSTAVTQGKFSSPDSLAYDSSNNRLFVSDRTKHRVLVFDVTTITNGEDAASILGQTDFTTATSGTSQNKFNSPSSLTYDGVNGRLFVSDTTNNRVMVFDVVNITNGENAVNVLGQTDFVTASAATTQSKLSSPNGFALDGANNRLFVSDTNNSRVLVFNVATNVLVANNTATDGPSAVNVLGHSDFTTGSLGIVTATTMNYPHGLAYDSANSRLFVADYLSYRVLTYNVATNVLVANNAATDGPSATAVLGESDLVTASYGTSQSKFQYPNGIAYDGTNSQLFLADAPGNRVMVFSVTSISNGEDAVDLLGQFNDDGSPNYSQSNRNNGSPGPKGFSNPADLALDTASHRLFVADSSNNRVLVFNLNSSNQPLDYTADNVLGQTDFVTGTSGVTASTLNFPRSLAYDNARNYLFVLDATNQRVMVFDVANIMNGENAINVLGQTDFVMASTGTTAGKFNTPRALAYDAVNQRLFVTDITNNRLLVFDVTSISNGEDAVNVLGQTDFVTGTSGTTAGTLKSPSVPFYDSAGNRLFVTDRTNNRLLIYDVSTLTNGEDAVNVLGQTDFVTGTSGTTAGKLKFPAGITYDSSTNRLFVVDGTNHRVLIYDVSTVMNGEDAVNVLGQTDFVTGTSGTTQSALKSPSAALYDAANGRLLVADTSNHRVLFFDAAPPNSAPSVTINSVSEGTDGTGAVAFSLTVSDADFNGVKLKIEYKSGSDCSSGTADPTLDETPAAILASVGTRPDMTNANPYQMGTATSIATSSANTVTFRWSSATDVPTANGTYCVKITPNDGTTDGTAQTATLTLDNVPPVAAGNLTISARSADSLTFNLGTAGSDTNINNYKIYYKAGGSGVTLSDTLHATVVSGAYTPGNMIQISGLGANTQYVANVWTYDSYENRTASAELAAFTAAATPAALTLDGPTPSTLDATINSGVNPANTTYAIQVTGSGQYVQANGALDASAVFQTMSQWGATSGVSGKITVTGLDSGSSYTFATLARNGDGVNSSASPNTTLATLLQGSRRQPEKEREPENDNTKESPEPAREVPVLPTPTARPAMPTEPPTEPVIEPKEAEPKATPKRVIVISPELRQKRTEWRMKLLERVRLKSRQRPSR